MKLVHVGFCGGVSSALADVTEVQEHKLLGLLAKLSGWAWKPPCSPLEHKPKSCSGESVYIANSSTNKDPISTGSSTEDAANDTASKDNKVIEVQLTKGKQLQHITSAD
ncbi:hypothetical protein PGTUg99_032536 [Puccinia graminis f. sp. tritici]|uniref:Uncharacterized protein n=1 Tax=Puccinia graminis f. sp. tritici TaxID=56615 RepID=A0A5B0SKZ6_PUCGR|nr:hypothetical protein PGTUg99_032536 [Puccinia graminis f. sp. tritici]